jgi:hypothetical protein
MATDRHCDRLRHTRANHVPDCRPTKVMKQLPTYLAFLNASFQIFLKSQPDRRFDEKRTQKSSLSHHESRLRNSEQWTGSARLASE